MIALCHQGSGEGVEFERKHEYIIASFWVVECSKHLLFNLSFYWFKTQPSNVLRWVYLCIFCWVQHSFTKLNVHFLFILDQQYSSYYPQYHRPLRKLLGKPLYLEVRLLNSLDPSAVLLVHYCVAYPRSAHSAWVLIYDGYGPDKHKILTDLVCALTY